MRVAAESTWRCPECHTVQARTTRCWRCSKPVYTCETCRQFRPSVAADLGICAGDPTGALVSARDSRACWASQATPTGPTTEAQLGGLFSELEPVEPVVSVERPQPFRTAPSIRGAPDQVARMGADRSPRQVKPHLEDAGRAAWVEPDGDRLVDAPSIEPGKRLSTEMQRRRRRWFR